MNPEIQPSAFAVLAHLALVVILCVLFTRAVRDAGLRTGLARELVLQRTLLFGSALVAWLGFSYGIAHSGWLLHTEHVPPRIVFVLGPGAVICTGLALSSFGRTLIDGLPLAWLVGYQAFRIAVELVLWLLYRESVLPEQMTFEGANLDVVSGASALFVAGLLARGMGARWLVWVWNCGALLLLCNIVGIAVRLMQLPEPPNRVILGGVFVWIPALYVLAAFFGHVLVFRALLSKPARA